MQRINLPQIDASTHGIVASPQSRDALHLVRQPGPPGGSLLASTSTGPSVWQRDYRVGIDSMAISADGREIYMPAGKARETEPGG